MTEYTSNTQDVRELAQSVVPDVWTDAEIIEEQKAAYNYIAIGTHKFDWQSTDNEYPSIQKLEAQIAKCYILEHYGNRYREQIDYEMKKYDATIANIKDNMTATTGDEEGTLERTDLKSWNLGVDSYQSKLNRSLRSDTMGVTD